VDSPPLGAVNSQPWRGFPRYLHAARRDVAPIGQVLRHAPDSKVEGGSWRRARPSFACGLNDRGEVSATASFESFPVYDASETSVRISWAVEILKGLGTSVELQPRVVRFPLTTPWRLLQQSQTNKKTSNLLLNESIPPDLGYTSIL